MALIKCSECNKEVSDKATSCPGCGAPIGGIIAQHVPPIVVTSPKSRSMAAVLALFLGGLGIHKFYLNSPGWGFIYLIFCWTFVPAILGFIEALNYIFMSDKTFQKRYAK
jgi:TM2 domain-containing membrane protein YozV